MNCRNLRIDFVKRSGRYDLVKTVGEDTWVDNGANAYVNRGQKLLDSLITLPCHERRLIKPVAVGDWQARFQHCRVLREVWIANGSDGRAPLKQVSMSELRRQYPDGDFPDIEPGIPRLFALASGFLAPEQRTSDAEDFTALNDWQDVQFGDDPTVYGGIVWMPPADRELTLDVFGLWWTEPMTADDSLTWWGVNEPDLLVRATLCEIETDHRNTEGVTDWMNSMQPRLRALDHDMAESETRVYTKIVG